jgi:hypothetical protein
MAEKKKEEFVVQDRRRFSAEGELTTDTAERTESAAPAQPPTESKTESAEQAHRSEMPLPPTAAEQKQQHGEYKTASKKIDDMIDAAGARRPANLDVTFEGLVASLYMQAMIQLGMIREENTPPRPDIVGARHTIDTISLLEEKTKGNLTEREAHMLQNALFELRMAFLEITNVLTTAPPPGAPKGK